MALRRVRKNWKARKKTAVKLQALIEDKFNEEKLFKNFVDQILGFDSSLIEPVKEEIVLEFG